MKTVLNNIDVAIIDDDFDLRDSLQDYFIEMGFSVASFSSGVEFLEQSQISFHGVVVCDLKMPEMSGLDVLQALNAKGRKTPFILMSAFGDIPLAVKAMSLGAYDFLEKPFDPAILSKKIQAVITTYKSQLQQTDSSLKLRDSVESFEKSLLIQALNGCSGHVGKVCEMLNIPRRTLNEKLLKYGISRHDYTE